MALDEDARVGWGAIDRLQHVVERGLTAGRELRRIVLEQERRDELLRGPLRRWNGLVDEGKEGCVVDGRCRRQRGEEGLERRLDHGLRLGLGEGRQRRGVEAKARVHADAWKDRITRLQCAVLPDDVHHTELGTKRPLGRHIEEHTELRVEGRHDQLARHAKARRERQKGRDGAHARHHAHTQVHIEHKARVADGRAHREQAQRQLTGEPIEWLCTHREAPFPTRLIEPKEAALIVGGHRPSAQIEGEVDGLFMDDGCSNLLLCRGWVRELRGDQQQRDESSGHPLSRWARMAFPIAHTQTAQRLRPLW